MDRSSLALASGALTFACALPYVVAVWRGHARPQRVSFLVFTALSATAAAAQFEAGEGPGAWLSLGSAFGFAVIFASSIRRGSGGMSAGDVATLAVAALSVVLFLAADRPMLALLTVVAAEIAAVGLSVHKTSRDPDSEIVSSWAIDAAAGVVAIAAVTHLTAGELLYPVHHTVVNLWMVATVMRGRRRTAIVSA